MSDDGASPHPRDRRRNVEINVGKACNSRCVFCLDGMATKADQAFMPWSHMRAELARWRAEGYESVGLLGGEPTIYPHLTEAIAHAQALGYTRIAIATNAMRLAWQAFADELVAAGLTRVTISMHGHTAALEDALSGVPGGFEKKCQAIAHLQRHRRSGALRDGLSVNVVLNGHNYRQLPRMMRFFFDELGLDDLRANFIRPEGNAAGNTTLTPSFTAVMPLLEKAIVLNEYHFHKAFTFGGLPLCVLPAPLLASGRLLARYAGDLFRDLDTACSIRSEGYDDGVSLVEDGRARFSWQERKRMDLKHRLDVCARCELAQLCEGVWREYLEMYGGAELSPLRRHGDRIVRPLAAQQPPRVPRMAR